MKRIIVLITLCATLGYAKAQVCGCTDPRANNYNPQATVNDGSCTYASTTVSPYYSNNLPTRINGTSGLIYFDGKLYTHNDHTDKKLYQIDTTDGHILDSLRHVLFFDDMAESHLALVQSRERRGGRNTGRLRQTVDKQHARRVGIAADGA